MEEKLDAILGEINQGILSYQGDSLFDAGLLDSFEAINLVGELEDNFDVEIDAKYVVEENFATKAAILALLKKLLA